MDKRSYARNPAYSKPPRWPRLYDKHCPRDTDGASRHAKMIAESLRDPKSPVRRLLIDAGYEPDHWASSIETTVRSLWATRAKRWADDPEGMQTEQDRQTAKAIQALKNGRAA